MSSTFRRITSNLKPARIRYEMLEGKKNIVVPTVMLTEGVHNGSEGPLLYLNEDLAKNPQTWNHKPVVVYHPTMNGVGVSACDPAIIESHKTGLLFNSAHDGRLVTESWLEEDRLKLVDNRIYTALMNKQMVEVSTGLFNDVEMTPGEWKGEKYIGIVRNIQPDHLALLPDQVGACSIEDGAGLLRNAEVKIETGLSLDDIRRQVSTLLRENRTTGDKSFCDDYCYVMDVYKAFVIYEGNGRSYKVGYKVKGSAVSLVGAKEEVRRVTSYVTANLSAKDGKVFRLPYCYNGDKIGFGHEPEEVSLTTAYATVSNPTGNQTMADALPVVPPVAVPPADARKSLIDTLIASGDYKEEDRASLTPMPETTLGRLVAASKKTTAIAPPNPPPVPVPAPLSMEAFIANAPPGLRDPLTEMYSGHLTKRTSLIATISGNMANRFPKEWLETQPTTMLEGLVSLATPVQSGQPPAQPAAGGSGYAPGSVPLLLPLNNSNGRQTQVPVLDLPTMDFSTPSK